MGIKNYACNGCKTVLNDCDGSYARCACCAAVYCYGCDDCIRYSVHGLLCPLCDPHRVRYSNEQFVEWIVKTFIPTETVDNVLEKFRSTLCVDKVQCGQCLTVACTKSKENKQGGAVLEENYYEGDDELVGWCCKCSQSTNWCGECTSTTSHPGDQT